MVYTPNEDITILEELVVLREKYPFCLFIKSQLGKYGLLVMHRIYKQSQFIPLQNVVYIITLPFFGS